MSLSPSAEIGRIDTTVDEHVAILTLNRPEAHNCIDHDMLVELHANLRSLADNDDVRCVVIAGSGRSFSAGIDLTAVAEGRMPPSAYELFEEVVWLIETMPKPVLASIHSNCIGAGFQIALACDLRVAESGARFYLPAAREGLIPGVSPHRLWRFTGLALARRMVLFGEVLDSPSAARYGLIDELLPPDTATSVRHHAVALATKFAATLPTASFRACKEMLSLPRSGESDFLDDYLREQAACRDHPDHHRAAAAWLDQRSA